MDEIVTWLWNVDYWHWWALGLILIALEAFVASTHLLWPGISAIAVGILVAIVPGLDWRLQLLVFAVLAVVTSIGWQVWLRKHPATSDHPHLNTRGRSHVGRRLTLDDDLPDGEGRIHLGDSWWLASVENGQALEQGARVEVVGVEGTTLILRPLPAA